MTETPSGTEGEGTAGGREFWLDDNGEIRRELGPISPIVNARRAVVLFNTQAAENEALRTELRSKENHSAFFHGFFDLTYDARTVQATEFVERGERDAAKVRELQSLRTRADQLEAERDEWMTTSKRQTQIKHDALARIAVLEGELENLNTLTIVQAFKFAQERIAMLKAERDGERLRYGQQQARNSKFMQAMADAARDGRKDWAKKWIDLADAASKDVRLDDFVSAHVATPTPESAAPVSEKGGEGFCSCGDPTGPHSRKYHDAPVSGGGGGSDAD